MARQEIVWFGFFNTDCLAVGFEERKPAVRGGEGTIVVDDVVIILAVPMVVGYRRNGGCYARVIRLDSLGIEWNSVPIRCLRRFTGSWWRVG